VFPIKQILDNRRRGNVGDYLAENIDKKAKLSIVSAYFTIYAYNELKDQLNKIEQLRFLFGEPTFVQNDNLKENRQFIIEKTQRENAVSGTGIEIKLKNSLTQKSIALECAEWIRQKVEIRSLVKPDFLHGKAYIMQNPNENDSAIVGSSNFTVSGLGLKGHSNMELNIVTDESENIKELLSWFNEIWDHPDMVEDVKAQVLETISNLFVENSPEFLYFVTIYNIFKSFVEGMDENDILSQRTGFAETRIWNMLYNFQKDGVIGAINKLESHGGCILADSVGLGKTFEALAVIKYYELKNLRVLVLAPKKLRENWGIYTVNDRRNILSQDRFNFDLLNHTDLSRETGKSGDINLETLNWGNYDLVVIDESHNFRNNPPVKGRLTRYQKLMQHIIKAGVKTKVLMLSATPVNNRMNDLKNQIAFITEGNDRALYTSTGIKSIEITLKEAQKRFKRWTELPDHRRTTEGLLDSLNFDYFTLLNTLTIARSRRHIQKYYKTDDIGDFPKRLNPISIKADIDLNNEFPELKAINTLIRKLHLSLYKPLSYVLPERAQDYSKLYDIELQSSVFRQTDRELSLTGLIRINLFKRLESSVNSFCLSVERLLNNVNATLDIINNQSEEYFKDADISEIDIDDPQYEDLLLGNKVKVLLHDLDLIRLNQDLAEDQEKLQYLYDMANRVDVNRDAKLKILKSIIADKQKNYINDGNRKVLVFTAFADTANYIYENIASWAYEKYGIHSALVTGTTAGQTNLKGIKREYNSILTSFSPVSKSRAEVFPELKDEIDILIATDCISEGQNLQDCDYLCNYDIHWNPVRIIQRFGRIDRLGSKNDRVQLVNFWPNVELDEYINLEARVSNRMVLLDVSATGEENLIKLTEKELMNDLEYRRKQLEQLQNRILDMEDLSGGISITDLTLDDFRMDLIRYIKTNPGKLEKAPTGLHALVPIKPKLQEEAVPGVLFCLKQSVESAKERQTNSLHPYYLVYMAEDGQIYYAHTQPKKILDIYKGLCAGEETVYEELCAEFNHETNDGAMMRKYSDLLENAVNSVIGIKEEKGLESIFSLGGTRILDEKLSGRDDFELISFLIVR
jgi:superfamily II DNA or RNA helicase